MADEMIKKEQVDVVAFKATAMTPEELEAYHDEMDGLNAPLFKIVKCPSAGVTTFEVPTGVPDETEPKKELVGVILYHHPLNRYYENPIGDSDDGQAPDCVSFDGQSGMTKEGECRACATCALNQYGTGTGGRGKACSNRHGIYILQEGDMLPTRLDAPPTSLRPLGSYVSSLLLMKKVRPSACVTKITVKKEKNGNGQDFSLLQFSFIGALSEKVALDTAALGNQVKAQVKSTVGRYANDTKVVDAEMTEVNDADLPEEFKTKK